MARSECTIRLKVLRVPVDPTRLATDRHALFFNNGSIIDSPEAFAAVFRNELLPLLQEYLYEDYTELSAVLGPVIDATTERPASIIDDPDQLCEALAAHFGAIADA